MKKQRVSSKEMKKHAALLCLKNRFRNHFIKFPDIHFLRQIQFELAKRRPKLELRIEIEGSGILR